MDMLDVNTSKLAELTVLLVDDDKTIRDIIVHNLRGIGFIKFIQASNGLDANDVFSNSKNEIDLILCDWDMPKADGLAFLKSVRAHPTKSETPFIMITAQQSQERQKISQAQEYQVNAYIVKPFDSETLRKKVIAVLFSNEKSAATG